MITPPWFWTKITLGGALGAALGLALVWLLAPLPPVAGGALAGGHALGGLLLGGAWGWPIDVDGEA